MEEDRAVRVRLHSHLLQTRANLRDDRVGPVRFDNPAIATQQIENERVGNSGAVKNAATFDKSRVAAGNLAAELGQEPRFADAGLADDADRPPTAVFRLVERLMQQTELVGAADEDGRMLGRSLPELRAPERHQERLGLAGEPSPAMATEIHTGQVFCTASRASHNGPPRRFEPPPRPALRATPQFFCRDARPRRAQPIWPKRSWDAPREWSASWRSHKSAPAMTFSRPTTF